VDNPHEEWLRLQEAIATADAQLVQLEEQTAVTIGREEAAVFEAHRLFLQDPDLLSRVRQMIEEECLNAEAAVHDAFVAYVEVLEAMDDDYFRTRATDVRDVGRRLIHCLLGETTTTDLPQEPVIVLAEDLTPSDTAQFDRSRLLGLVTVRGGPTSHTAILARGLGIPAVVSAPVAIDEVDDGTTLILDGESGGVVLSPTPDLLGEAEAKRSQWQQRQSLALASAAAPAITLDGHQLEVVANIGGVADVAPALEAGAEGVGLFRTEFLFLNRDQKPSEAEQIAAYREVAEALEGRPLIVRTLDIGGDKMVPYIEMAHEANPFLGWRGVRMLEGQADLFRTQLRALLQGCVGADLRLMVPMVSSVEEVRAFRALVREVREALRAEGKPVAEKMQFGIMVEVPAMALIANQVAPLVDFFSIGTNDLTQYTLAIDRTNERVAAMASPFHPAVLRLIQMTIEAGHAHGIWVGLCGEFAAQPLAVPFLLGAGLDEFSVSPASIPAVKALIRRLNRSHCEEVAAQAVSLESAAAVKAFLEKELPDGAI
jgi:phosphoenolpyruvate-protein phosphotransferase